MIHQCFVLKEWPKRFKKTCFDTQTNSDLIFYKIILPEGLSVQK
jgi:hypothetical protein